MTTIYAEVAADMLRDARAILRDLHYGWQVRELHMSPADLIDNITNFLDDGYDIITGDCDEALTCDECGRIGNREDGIEPGGPCQEPCEGTVRRVEAGE